MANQSTLRVPNKTIKICTINICGLSVRSKMLVNKYNDIKDIDILAVQETGSGDLLNLELLNMSVICDTNKASNKGTALYVNNKHSITKLDTISKLSRNIDSCWGLVVIGKKRYIIGNVYVKLNHKPAITEVLKMLRAAEQKQTELKASGIILTGDFNARHLSWGDTVNNYYGNCLAEGLDNTKYSLCTSETPTFLCANGSSKIDLFILSNSLADLVESCKTDEDVELFSGAPTRGHVPVTVELLTRSPQNPQPVVEKLDITSIQWDSWKQHIEDKIEEDMEYLEQEENPFALWNHYNQIIAHATDTYGETKKCSQHSKPYWTESLTALSVNLRTTRKNYIKRNTDINLKKLKEAKEVFDEERKSACQNFLINTAKTLNSAQALRFWKDFNKLFKKKSPQKIDPLIDENGDLLTDNDKLDKCLFSAFFEGKHLIDGDFDDTFYREINNIYEQIMTDGYEDEVTGEHIDNIQNLNREISMPEIIKAIKSTGKSADNFKFHPVMFRHLGEKSMIILQRLFNLCLKTHMWVWNGAEVIFLRKSGKDSYAKPGSYRPICITSYIGKLLETIVAIRIEALLLRSQQTDPYQEGFSACKNTIRYLSRLHLGIHADIEKYLTIICLFVDFEKAFDSVWKRGLMVKLHKLGVQGNVAKLINNFLFSRKLALNINGEIGNTRQSSEYGLPQGAVLSPVLFKIYVQDFLIELNQRPDIAVLKFADDGTIKITAPDSATCVEKVNYVLDCLHKWSMKWRLKVNCDRNKTEIIAFNTAEGNSELIPKTFKLGNKDIHRVSETKVLGLIIDEKLTYKSHSLMVQKSLNERWATICKYSNKHWGFNLNVMLQLLRALFISKLAYASHIWITNQNMEDINKLWYHILKSITGAVLNVSQIVAEIILGIPPIVIQTKVNSIKHFLKINNKPVQNDVYSEFLEAAYNQDTREPKAIHSRYKDVFNFLKWKILHYPSHFNDVDQTIVNSNEFGQFNHLSLESCTYTQPMMKTYTENMLWASALKNQFQLDGYHLSPKPSCNNIPIPKNTTRKSEVQLMSLLYKNNLLNQSLYNISKVPSPLCTYCHLEEETAEHLLFKCTFVEEQLRTNAESSYRHALNLAENEDLPDSYIGLLCACKDAPFVKTCIAIIEKLDIRVTFEL